MWMSLRRAALWSAIATASIAAAAATTQDGPLQALENKYKITQMTVDRTQVADPGTTMEIVANGINAQPWGGLVTFDNPIVDGKVQQRSTATRWMSGAMNGLKNTHIMQPGDKVYITKMETINTDSKYDVLRLVILTSDQLDVSGEDAQRRYSAGLSFRFPKNTLAEASPDELEQDIEAILKPSTGDSDAGQQQASAAPQQAAPPPQQAAPPPPPPAPVQTATITLGETTEQVISAMGLPKQVIDLGTKKIYQYPSMKVTFINDKVKDVE